MIEESRSQETQPQKDVPLAAVPNLPSTTGNKSGRNLSNNPPAKK